MAGRGKQVNAPALKRLLTEIGACRICRDSPQGQVLPHEPNPILRVNIKARLCVAGQAAGTRAHAASKPFDDPSGERLREWMGIGEDVFYDETRLAIVPMGFCFPGLDEKGGDLPPRKECAPAWRARVFEHLPNVETILLVGAYAQRWHLGRGSGSLTETVRHWRDHAPRFIPLPHPSWRNNVWLKKNRWFADEVLPYLRARVAELTSD